MNKSSLQMIAITLVLILLQVIVLNRICLFGMAVPLAFIYVILRFPVTLSKEWLFTIAFALGLIIDIFSDTDGINAMSCLIIAALRQPVLHLYMPRKDDLTDNFISIGSLGFTTYFKYALSLTAVYCISAFCLESLTFLNWLHLAECIASSTVLTTAFIIGIDSLTLPRREKRLQS